MKIQELLLEMYTAYVLTDASREKLKEKFPPKYSKFIGHHVTVDFGVSADSPIPEDANVTVVGKKDSGDGLEALVVSVNNETERPDGSIYHITWSLDPEKYSPKDSNTMFKNDYNRYTISLPIQIETTPSLLK